MSNLFLNYYLDREDSRKAGDFNEMAAPEIRYGEKGQYIHEKRKVPIFFDTDDVTYLAYFPPELWAQALAQRYGKLLFQAHHAIQKGEHPPQFQDVTLNYRGQLVTFKNVDAHLDDLHNKLTKDVDDDYISTIGNTPKEKEEYKKRGAGHYGFVLKNPQKSTKHKELEFGEGYLGLTKAIASKRLGAWRKGINDGWLGDIPRNAAQQKVSFAGGKSSKSWTYGVDDLRRTIGMAKGPSKPFQLEKNIPYWTAYPKKGNPVEISSPLPVMAPAKLIDAKDMRKYYNLNKMAQMLVKDSDNSEEFEKYKNLIDPASQAKWEQELDGLRSSLYSQGRIKGKISQAQNRETLAKIENIQDVLDLSKMLKEKLGTQINTMAPDQLRQELKYLATDLKNNAREVQKKAPRYDVHDWNVHHFNADKVDPTDPSSREKYPNLHTNIRGLGTFNTNWQQKETAHGGLLKMGVDPIAVWNDLVPHLVQAGHMQGNNNKTGSGDIPYVVKHPNDPRGDKGEEGDKLAYGPLARGISNFIRSKVPSGSPAYYAMIKNWWPIFQNASMYLRGRLGGKYFLPYARAKKNNDPQAMGAAIVSAEHGAYKAGYNYASMVYQLKTRLPDEESIDQNIGDEGTATLADRLSQEDGKMSDLANKIMTKFNRSIRPSSVDTGDIGMTGHDIEILKQIVSQEVEKETEHVPVQAASSEEKEMAKNIIDSALTFQVYRHIFILDKEKNKQEKLKRGEQLTPEDDWNIQSANEFANSQVDKLLSSRGIHVNAAIPMTKKAAINAAKTEKEEEANLKKGMQDRHAQAAKQMAPGTAVNIGNQELTPELQAQHLKQLTNKLNDPQMLAALDSNSPTYDPDLRAYFQRNIQDKAVGHETMAAMLQKTQRNTPIVKPTNVPSKVSPLASRINKPT